MYLRIAAVQLVSHDVARAVAGGNPAPTLEVHSHNTAVDGPDVSGSVGRNHRSPFHGHTAHQVWHPLCPDGSISRRRAGLEWVAIVLTQANAIPTIPLLSAIIRHMRLGDQPVSTTIQVVCTPPGPFGTRDRG